jgi:hypothetical protein
VPEPIIKHTQPKDRRKRSTGHEQSVKQVKRQFAVQENGIEHVEVGALEDVSGMDILRAMGEPEEPRSATKKKEKQQLKKEAFIDKLQSTRSPYSKTQRRRFKRKQQEQVGGGLDAIQAAISALDNHAVSDGGEGHTEELATESIQPKMKPKPGQIGEGQRMPLSRNQRKRALELERLRAPMILANPDYASNPFQTIRTHAQNTLLKHEHPA